ncbi:glycerol-3-phosphate dehydrogenase, partial [Vibrio metoecus]
LAGVTGIEDLGIAFSGELYQREVDYLWDNEFARHAQDIFWRRTKLGLNHDTSVVAEVEAYLQQKIHATHSSKATA